MTNQTMERSNMSLAAIPFNDIGTEHLQQLIDNGVPEGVEVDYKRDPYGGDDKNRTEFLRDITSFANASGGHLVIGMDETGGIPINFDGFTVANIDNELQKYENLARDAVEPRIVGLQMKHVLLDSGNYIIVIRVPRSWNPPHRANFKKTKRFYTRNSTGAHEVSVEELRSLFTLSADFAEKVRLFRIERLAKIKASETPFPIKADAIAVLHIVPLVTFRQENIIDLETVYEMLGEFSPMKSYGISRNVNLDGIAFTSSGDPEDLTYNSYTQVFRDGTIEAVIGGMVMSRRDTDRVVPWADLDVMLFKGVKDYLAALANVSVAPPYAVMISLLEFRNASLITSSWGDMETMTDRDDIIVPPVTIQISELEGDWHHLLRPAMDAIFNAFGILKALGFDEDGKWTPTR